MSNKHFFRTSLISSVLFFVIATILDFLLTWQTNDIVSYVLFFALSFLVFGPMIAILVTDFKRTHFKRRIDVSI